MSSANNVKLRSVFVFLSLLFTVFKVRLIKLFNNQLLLVPLVENKTTCNVREGHCAGFARLETWIISNIVVREEFALLGQEKGLISKT